MRKSAVTPWSYRKGFSPLHRLPAGFKLIFMLLLSFAAFFPGPQVLSVIILVSIVFILAALSFAAGIGPQALLRGSSPLFFIILAVFIFKGIEVSPLGFRVDELETAIIFCARIGMAFAAGSLFFSVTTSGDIKKSLSHLEVFLHLEKLRLSLSISLMLKFLPCFFESWEDLSLAWESRGGKKNLHRLAFQVSLTIEKMIEKAAETATAMEARATLL
jgi:biotin transport system permease protein